MFSFNLLLMLDFSSADVRETNKKRLTLSRLLRGLKTINKKANHNTLINKVRMAIKIAFIN